jgi:hypothetical protein
MSYGPDSLSFMTFRKGEIGMSLARFVTFVFVATVLFLIVGWPHPWWMTLLIGLVAGGAGYGVDAFSKRRKEPTESHAADSTPADRRWAVKMLVKQAIASEDREDWERAMRLFRRVIQEADTQEDADLARQHLQAIQKKRTHDPDGAEGPS